MHISGTLRVTSALFAALLVWVGSSVPSTAQEPRRIDAPFVPTPQSTVELMLRMARVGPGDVLYDLGSGDGRIPVTAVRDFGAARAVGIDIDSERVADGIANAAAAGVSDLVHFRQADVFTADFSEATVVTMYLLQHLNLELRPKLLSMLQPGTRLVSYEFHLGEWEADDVRSPSSLPVRPGEIAIDDESVFIYSWIVPAQVGGSWELESNGQKFRLDLTQSFQKIAGTIHAVGGHGPIEVTKIIGSDLKLYAPISHRGSMVRVHVDVTANGDILDGYITVDGVRSPVSGTRF